MAVVSLLTYNGRKSGKQSGKTLPTLLPTGGTRRNRSARAGLQFPVSRIHRILKATHRGMRIQFAAPIYLASVLEYLIAELLELAGNAARDLNKRRIIPRHLQLAIRKDEELQQLLGNVVIMQGGVIPHIEPSLLPQRHIRRAVKSEEV
ncbi:histone-fold-containing protein [Mucidula mucida]|nr:histone-fold-containing protein [Mucidula mucida]